MPLEFLIKPAPSADPPKIKSGDSVKTSSLLNKPNVCTFSKPACAFKNTGVTDWFLNSTVVSTVSSPLLLQLANVPAIAIRAIAMLVLVFIIRLFFFQK